MLKIKLRSVFGITTTIQLRSNYVDLSHYMSTYAVSNFVLNFLS